MKRTARFHEGRAQGLAEYGDPRGRPVVLHHALLGDAGLPGVGDEATRRLYPEGAAPVRTFYREAPEAEAVARFAGAVERMAERFALWHAPADEEAPFAAAEATAGLFASARLSEQRAPDHVPSGETLRALFAELRAAGRA
ncbi:hypothetical protein [Streptomyces griseus]|uniref:hypothetical protein n=2 Tax=Streptomyces TaxID=1883 RepID=UPI0037FCBBB3